MSDAETAQEPRPANLVYVCVSRTRELVSQSIGQAYQLKPRSDFYPRTLWPDPVSSLDNDSQISGELSVPEAEASGPCLYMYYHKLRLPIPWLGLCQNLKLLKMAPVLLNT